ncbi:bifunctional DNA primase/polymerase [Streptomyces sp. NPDC048527]|uniref:bifunctional DNA primase/polymerase n=1 Tax=Streptomyces sp. NPDC048527 TaxID=3365568 RepID=UPI003714DB45
MDKESAASQPPTSRDIAQWCAAQGWPVHPLVGKQPVRNCLVCSGDRHRHRPGDCPCIAAQGWCHSFHAATLDPSGSRSWNPAWGVGVACGAAGLVVIDIDVHDKPLPERSKLVNGFVVPDHVDLSGLRNGYHALAVLAAYRGRTSPADDTTTLRVRTPSGGLHVWYRLGPSHPPVRCSSGSDNNRTFLAWQVDVRASGGYIVAPGTRTGQGVYTPVPPATYPAVLPDWLLDDLIRTGHGPRETRSTDTITSSGSPRVPTARSRRPAVYLKTLLADVEACGMAPEGMGFSAKLNRAAWTAGGLVAGGLIDHGEARRQLLDVANTARPQRAHRNLAIINAALTQGGLHPLLPKGNA